MINVSTFARYKNVLLLGLTSLLNDISSEMVLPVLPLLIERLGGTGIAIGIIGGLRESFADLLKAAFGYWSDRVGKRKEFVYAGYISTMVFKFCLFLATSWYQILIFIGLERIGKGLRTAPRDAIIVQSMPDRVGTGFGIHRACDTLGALIGSALAAYAVWTWHTSLSTIIFWAFIVALFAVIPLYWVKDESAPQAAAPAVNASEQPAQPTLCGIYAAVTDVYCYRVTVFIGKCKLHVLHVAGWRGVYAHSYGDGFNEGLCAGGDCDGDVCRV
jgi:MFS family permease